MSAAAERMRSYREKHWERAAIAEQQNIARGVAARKVARAHPEEWEREMRAECTRRGVPRFLPPLPKELDGRGRR